MIKNIIFFLQKRWFVMALNCATETLTNDIALREMVHSALRIYTTVAVLLRFCAVNKASDLSSATLIT